MSNETPQPGALPPAAPAAEESKVGDRIGAYRLVRLIGEGATGRVFEVEHLKIGRQAAMKILLPEHAARPGAIKRLFSEAHAVNKINHPHIVEVTDLIQAEKEGEANAIVMELLEGRSLGEAMEQKVLRPEVYLPILSQVAGALAAAHAAHFVHRDLKPDNIFLTSRAGQHNYVKLLDFGLAKSIAGEVGRKPAAADAGPTKMPPPIGMADSARKASRTIIHATADGTFVGTPAYASPEQASGKPLDHRTDVYSLGVILYELLCGRLPFDGKTFGEYLVKHIVAPVPPPPAAVIHSPLGRALFSVVARCLAKKPEDRWSSAAELKDLLDKLARAAHAAAAADTGAAKAPTWRGPLAVLLGGALVLFSAALWVGSPRGSGTRAAAPTAETELPTQKPVVTPLVPEKMVDITFDSEPRGAETRIVVPNEEDPHGPAEDDLLGLTPFHHTFPANGNELEIEMRLAGYLPRRDKVLLTGDGVVKGRLKRLAGDGRRTGGETHDEASIPAKPKVTRGTTLNPFRR